MKPTNKPAKNIIEINKISFEIIFRPDGMNFA